MIPAHWLALIAEFDPQRAAIYRKAVESQRVETVLVRDGESAKRVLQHRGAPLLLIHGESDSIVPVSQAYQLAEAAGASCLTMTLPGGGKVGAKGAVVAVTSEGAVRVQGGEQKTLPTLPKELTAPLAITEDVDGVVEPLVEQGPECLGIPPLRSFHETPDRVVVESHNEQSSPVLGPRSLRRIAYWQRDHHAISAAPEGQGRVTRCGHETIRLSEPI